METIVLPALFQYFIPIHEKSPFHGMPSLLDIVIVCQIYVVSALANNAHHAYNMDMRFKEIERRLMADGWQLAGQRGSHCQYVHPTKPGRVTVPKHNGDVNPVTVRSIWRQAGIDERRTK